MEVWRWLRKIASFGVGVEVVDVGDVVGEVGVEVGWRCMRR